MRVWITGGAGFLGQRLGRRLESRGHSVISLSRRKDYESTHSYQIDLASEEAVAQLRSVIKDSGEPEAVIHSAARQPGLKGELRDYVKSNVFSTLNLIEALIPTPPKQIIYTSTLNVYGRPGRNPVAESDPAGGTAPYSATKRWAEQLFEHLKSGSKLIVLRIPSFYGKGQVDSFIDGLARIALQNQRMELFSRGELIRDALHVSDVVAAIDSCVTDPPEPEFICMNLGCGRAITSAEWATALVNALGSDSEIVPVDQETNQFDLYADIQLAQKTIGFQPTELRESMARYANELRT
ncbi:MAG TPA: NAD(P)-dependent oxidoreductase [Pyrinomonadaceae bacterium]